MSLLSAVESSICEGINSDALQSYLTTGLVPCNITLEHYTCAQLTGFTAQNLAQLLACKLSSNMTYSREIWKLLLIKTSEVLEGALILFSGMSQPVMGPSVSHVLDVLGELILDSISDLQWKDISFISLLLGELSHQSDQDQAENVLKHFIQPFLSRNPSCEMDINKCVVILNLCGPNSNCANTNGSYNCSCLTGYQVANPNQSISESNQCTDVNECLQTPSVCGPNSVCNNTIGDYSCSCLSGSSAENPCTDVNECLETPPVCGPNSVCNNTIGDYNCSCLTGYQVANPNQTISESNQCTGSTITLLPLSAMTPTSPSSQPTSPTTLPTPPPILTSTKPTLAPTPIPAMPITLPATEQPSGPTTPLPGQFSTIRLSLTIKGVYDFRLNDPTSDTYNRFKTDIETAVEGNFAKIPGYKVNSVNVIGFRPGSIITDFSLQLSNPSISFLDASNGIINNLQANSYGFPDNPVAQSEMARLRDSTGFLFPRERLVLICSGRITEWRFDGQKIPDASGEILTITNINPANNGRYECVSTKNSLPFIQWENIDSIQPLPNIQTSRDKHFQCKVAQRVTLMCCSSTGYEVEMVKVSDVNNYLQETVSSEDCMYSYIVRSCTDGSGTVTFNCKLTLTHLQSFDYSSRSITLTFVTEEFDCSDENFGAGNAGQVVEGSCKPDEIGSVTAQCEGTDWLIIENNCVLAVINELEAESQSLTAASLPGYMDRLSNITLGNEGRISSSPANINSIVTILRNVGNVSQRFTITVDIMENFLNTSTVIVSNSTISAWRSLNNGNTTKNASASLLGSIEHIAGSLPGDTSFETGSDAIQLRQIVVNSSYSETLGADASAAIFIPEEGNFTITTITFSTLNFVLPARNSSDNGSNLYNSINAAVVLLQVNDTIKNISLSFDVINETLENPQCVFWNFELFDGLGGWDSFGCQLISFVNNTVTCECNHTTSFSMLMSPSIPPGIKLLLDFITYIGVGISLASLIICLIIEGIIWKSMARNDTSYMLHVSIVNVAVSLLIADIWFIIGAAISDSESIAVGPCTAATFFIHFFYLAMFFWMLVSALLLFYRTVMVFSQMKRSTMLAIGFCLGYGASLIIAVVTVAATAGGGGYIRENNVCWLNWDETKALLAFVIPALTIVAINFLVMIVVLFKMLKSGVGNTAQNYDRHTLVVIARCVTILTPLFGLTWGFGIGIMAAPEAVGLHVVFAVLNSLQGFLILVFGTLFDSQIKSILAARLRQPNRNSGGTRSTDVGTAASSTFDFFIRIRRRNAYNISRGMLSPQVSSSNNGTDTTNT
ncbi:adhesion G protein-coupled receptor F5-like [Sardina pilchardus]|uniref:adhesion G protein-coupled receptor F5-like n=1 Tax=Sardina pilchardus TaxID=27697 RepID=UPI002E12F6D5